MSELRDGLCGVSNPLVGAADRPYRLLRSPPPSMRPVQPDAAQSAVLDHPGGPLLVLAGPGTGKTTTLVEAVARRVEQGGLRPDEVLVLTFSRKAAEELRERITSRLGTPTVEPAAWTFHAFCYALVRQHCSPELYAQPLRLLSSPEQDVMLRDLLQGSLELGRAWPPVLRACLTTRGLAEEVRSLLARAREVGLTPADLAAIAAREGRADWLALAGFFGEYLDVLDAAGSIDYSEVIARAVALAEQPAVGSALRARFRAVYVDEYQDTDPAQERLLQALAGGGRDLVVVGDPDQAIYSFRGAEVTGLLGFPSRFPQVDGSPSPVLSLSTCRRSGPGLLEVSRRLAASLPAPGLAAADVRRHRGLVSAPGLLPGSVEVATHPSVGAEAEAVADLLRREHLEGGTPWSRMAVLVRSGARSVPLLRRVLSAAGVPLEVAGDELPLGQEPAVAPLLLALRVAADPAALTAEAARTLLLSPLGGADPTQLRRLGRALRARDRQTPEAVPAPSAELIRQSVGEVARLAGVEPSLARPAARLAELLARARAVLAGNDGPEAALWELWSGSPWPRRLAAASLAGGANGRAADRDLDAVVALFAAVGRAGEHRRLAAVGPLLDELQAQQIPGDTLADHGVRGEAVRLLTAHRSKGLEWDVVVVCGVQEGVWPDLRQRGSLLEPDRLPAAGADLRVPLDRSALLADERRLFYVAVTRARRRVVITAVQSAQEDGERPSRFLAETGIDVVHHTTRTRRPLNLSSLVATLRHESVDPARSPAMRRAAAVRLAQLAVHTDDRGALLAPAAVPDRWWGLAVPTTSEHPILPAGEPVRMSGSSLSGLSDCPLKWFLEHEVQAKEVASTAMSFGSVLHVLADDVGSERSPADLADMERRLGTVWDALAYEAPWQSRQQHDAAKDALRRFLHWHTADRGREIVATEHAFAVPVTVGGVEVLMRGSMDRVERDSDGGVHVVDLKTGRSAATNVATHPQLGVYQLAVQAGALAEVLAGPVQAGGAELVQLRVGDVEPKVQAQPVLPSGPSWLMELLETAVRRLLEESFPPTPTPACDRCRFRRCCPARPEGRQVIA